MTEQQPSNQDLSFAVGLVTIFLCAIFGSNAVAIKLAFSGLGVFTTAAIRFSIAALAIFVWARVTGQTIGLKKGQLHQVLILAVLFAIQLSMFYFGLSKSNASRGTLIANLLPFWVLFLAHFFIPGDRISGRKFLGILLGFSGVAFMFAETKGMAAGFRAAELMIISATFIWACSVIYLKRIISGYTREAGLRNLEREIASICRKLARRVLREKTSKGSAIEVTTDLVRELLGKRADVRADMARNMIRVTGSPRLLREAADLIFHGVRKTIEAKELTFDLARLREAIRQPATGGAGKAEDQIERLVPGAKLVGTSGFGEAVVRHMTD